MPDPVAVLRLPDPQLAPAYRDALASRSRFKVEDFGGEIAAVAPVEGHGAVGDHFELNKVCDAHDDLDDPETWRSLREHPPRPRTDVDSTEWQAMIESRARALIEKNPSTEAEIAAFALSAMGAGQLGELGDLLKINLPVLFERFPEGSLWHVVISDVLLARLAFGRTQLAFQLTPDLPLGEEMERLRAFEELTMTKGVDIGETLNVPLLALSPAVLGFLIPALPNLLVFCFGSDVDLRRPYPTSLNQLYRPRVLGDPEGLDRSAFTADPDPRDGELLLRWWVERLNQLYSHASDPTRFTDSRGYHDAAAQTAWMITFERLLGDAMSLLAEPQATELDRVQIAFDLLDKAEALLGYGRDESGKGFEALLRRQQAVPRLTDAYRGLPDNLAERLAAEVERLFDGLYDQIFDNTLDFRRTPGGARIGRDSADRLQAIDKDTLVASICRAVRNSSHGLLEILRDGNDRFLLAANTGGIPAELPALAPLIAIGLLADTDRLIDGGWRRELVGRQ